MDKTSPQSPAVKRPRGTRLLIEILAFLIGLALLFWCIREAIEGGDWQKVLHAEPRLIAGLVACSLVSLAVNGLIFWLVVQPVKHLRLLDLQLLNLVTSVLNYAPARLGLIARIAYHVRVDRMSLVQIGAWLAAIGVTLLGTLACVALATWLRPDFDWLWLLLLTASLTACGFALRTALNGPALSRYTRGMEQMLVQNRALWGAILLRLIDIAAFAGRMACAVAILGLPLTWNQILLLSIATIALTLIPIGRFGYREAGVALVAGYFGLTGEQFEGAGTQLALIESAGEALVFIPLGSLSLLWYRAKWKASLQVRADH